MLFSYQVVLQRFLNILSKWQKLQRTSSLIKASQHGYCFKEIVSDIIKNDVYLSRFGVLDLNLNFRLRCESKPSKSIHEKYKTSIDTEMPKMKGVKRYRSANKER